MGDSSESLSTATMELLPGKWPEFILEQWDHEGGFWPFQGSQSLVSFNSGTFVVDYPEMGDPAGQTSSNPANELCGDEFWPLSGKPFFDTILTESHVNPKYQMTMPSKLHPLLPSGEVPMVVTLGGRTWEMTCMAAKNNKQVMIYRPTWKAFVDDNNLKVGDGCVFELMDCSSTKLVFRVQILRGDIPAELLDKYSGEDAEMPILIN